VSHRSAVRRCTALAVTTVITAAGVLVSSTAAFAGVALTPYVVLSEPVPVPPQGFTFGTPSPYWSAVGIQPTINTDDDLAVSDTGGLFWTASNRTGSEVDVVAVNSNLSPLVAYQAMVRNFSGSGAYRIELAQGADTVDVTVPSTPQTIAMHGGFLAVRDIYLVQGSVYQFTIDAPSIGGGAAYLVASDKTYSSLDQAVASCRTNILAFSCGMTYTATRSGWNGLVLVGTGPTGGDLTVTVGRANPSPQPVP
jgi:hypothetical protein